MRAIVLLAAGAALGVLAYRTQVDALSPHERALATVAVGWSFLGAGLIAWARRPANRLGPLMVAAAFALLVRQLRYSHDSAVFTAFFALGDVCFALIGHSVFAYPFGRIRGLAERALVVAGYAVVLVFPTTAMLVYGGGPLLQYSPRDRIPRESVINVISSDHAAEFLQKAETVAFYGVLAALFIVVITRNLLVASPRMRRVLLPTLFGGVVVALRALFECIYTFVDRPFAYDVLFWWQIIAVALLPLALLAGLLRARLARAAVGDLLLGLERTPTQDLRAALARALRDPTLELALWLPQRRQYVDSAGRPLDLPPDDDRRRGVTRIVHDGEPVAALVHDRSLLEEPKLVQSAGAAARLALENARLQADLRLQLQDVRESRRRIVEAADEERRRIERDLHDGLQQQLVAVALRLQRLGARLDPEVEEAVAGAVDDLRNALQEVREIAQGIQPAILAEGGLAAALLAVADRAVLPVRVDVTEERFTPDVETTAYYLACEGLANALKHANATSAGIRAQRDDGNLVVEVRDDGIGGASVEGGSGLRHVADRVEAHGGRLRVESPAGDGTRVVGEIPCAS